MILENAFVRTQLDNLTINKDIIRKDTSEEQRKNT